MYMRTKNYLILAALISFALPSAAEAQKGEGAKSLAEKINIEKDKEDIKKIINVANAFYQAESLPKVHKILEKTWQSRRQDIEKLLHNYPQLKKSYKGHLDYTIAYYDTDKSKKWVWLARGYFIIPSDAQVWVGNTGFVTKHPGKEGFFVIKANDNPVTVRVNNNFQIKFFTEKDSAEKPCNQDPDLEGLFIRGTIGVCSTLKRGNEVISQ